VTLSFALSDASITVAQAATVALPRTSRVRSLVRLRSPWWAAAPPLAIVGYVAVVSADHDAARLLAYGALFALPPLAAFALARGVRGGAPRAALLVLPLFLTAWLARGSLAGESAGLVLAVLAAVGLAGALTQIVPLRWLMVGMLLMAAVDATLMVVHVLQPADALVRITQPGAGLPELQSTVFGSAVVGFGDFFIAALFGAFLAARRRRQLPAALITFVFALSFDLLFLVAHSLPATVPVAAALIVVEARGRLRRRPSRVAVPAPATAPLT
jgi:hypothetical protein